MTHFFLMCLRGLLLLLALTLLLGVMLLNQQSPLHYFDSTSLILVICSLVYLPVAFDPRHLWQALQDALWPVQAEHAERYAVSAYVWGATGRYMVAFGLIGFFLGLVQGTGNLDDLHAFGSTLALSLLPLLYASTLSLLVCLPVQLRLQAQHQILTTTLKKEASYGSTFNNDSAQPSPSRSVNQPPAAGSRSQANGL